MSYDPKRKKIQNAKNKAFPRKRHCMEKNITQIVKTREAVIKSGDPTSPKLAIHQTSRFRRTSWVQTPESSGKLPGETL